MIVGFWAWLFLAVLAVIVGISKTSIAGLAALSVAGFALVLPAKESTAAILLLLICGDIVAVRTYHKHADWGQLKKLLPAVVPGIVIGAVFMWFVSNEVLILTVAIALLVAVSLQIGLRVHDKAVLQRAASQPEAATDPPVSPADPSPSPRAGAGPSATSPAKKSSPTPAIAAGVAAGFTTMVANAAGAVMSLYLLAIKADKARFVGTGAWFFFLVNLTKVPFSIGLGLVHLHTLLMLVTLIPFVLVGTWLGRKLLTKLKQESFEQLTIGASALSAVVLLLKGVL
ncbi:MAG: sulfite exporter TauE/SafE family protein [Propionibacteriaceae bacterium]|nr:sulfite exporter TauE/SafE family protein [Propionibacteriaceae bacterium]